MQSGTNKTLTTPFRLLRYATFFGSTDHCYEMRVISTTYRAILSDEAHTSRNVGTAHAISHLLALSDLKKFSAVGCVAGDLGLKTPSTIPADGLNQN